MNHLINRRRTAGVASTTTLLLAIAVPASAHVEIIDGGAVLGGGEGTQITFRVPHGCNGAATDTIEVKVPDGVTDVKPKQFAGWAVETETASEASAASVAPMVSAAPMASAGGVMPTGPQVTVVRWTGGDLPDAEYADFQLMAVFPTTPGTLVFPVVQKCGDAQNAWIEIPAAGQDPETLEHPAPTVTIVAPAASPVP